eukprot:1161826-Pelagomonas_calceolata.AAC.4
MIVCTYAPGPSNGGDGGHGVNSRIGVHLVPTMVTRFPKFWQDSMRVISLAAVVLLAHQLGVLPALQPGSHSSRKDLPSFNMAATKAELSWHNMHALQNGAASKIDPG